MDEAIKRALNEQVSIPVVLADRAFGLSRNAAYAAVKSGQIPSVRIGARIAVPTAPLRRMLGIEETCQVVM